MSTLKERLAEVMAAKQWEHADLVRVSGESSSVVSQWLGKGSKEIKSIGKIRTAQRLEEASGYASLWLATGEGPKFPVHASAPGALLTATAHLLTSPRPGHFDAYDPSGETVRVPMMAVSASMGPGLPRPDEDSVRGALVLSPEWVRRHLSVTRPEALRVINGYGDSMRPTFASGDVLLVDTSAVSVDIDGVYVLSSADSKLFIKRVTRSLSGQLRVTSDNPVVKDAEELNGEHPVQVLGRVVWIWNGRSA